VPVTAQDFVYAYQRLLSPALAADYGEMLYPLKNAAAFNKGELNDFAKVGVKAVDDLTLELTLNGPTPYLPGMLKHYTWFPVPRHLIERLGGMTDRSNTWTKPAHIVGNGAFKLKAWRFTHYLAVERNPHYWDAATVKLNEIHFFPIANDSTEERAFQDGQLHMTETVPLPRVPFLRQQQPQNYHGDPILGCYFYRFNVTKKPFDDPRVRRALALAIDRQSITQNILRGGQQPCTSLTPPGCAKGYTAPNVLKFDPDAARRLLAEAGFPDGKGFPVFDILINTSESHRTVAEAIQEMWKHHLKIPARILNQDWQVYLESQRKLDYTVCRAGWLGDYPDPMTFLGLWRTGDGNNNTGWSNPAYDELVNTATTQADPVKRMATLHEAESLMLDELPILPLYWQIHAHLVSDQVRGAQPSILEHRCYKALDVQAPATGP
jgi:oligopeptide transport system substrate-binding protein